MCECVCQASAPLLSTTVEHSTVLVQPPAHTTSLFQPHLIQEIQKYSTITLLLLCFPPFLFVFLPHSPPGESRGMKTSDISSELTSHLARGGRGSAGGPHASVSVLYCSGIVLQCSRKSFKVPSLCFPPLLCSAASLQQDSGLFKQAHSSLGYTHTLSMHPLLGYLFIYHPSLHPSCWQPAGPTPADEEICERRKRKIDCSRLGHNQYPRHLQTFLSQLCLLLATQ